MDAGKEEDAKKAEESVYKFSIKLAERENEIAQLLAERDYKDSPDRLAYEKAAADVRCFRECLDYNEQYKSVIGDETYKKQKAEFSKKEQDALFNLHCTDYFYQERENIYKTCRVKSLEKKGIHVFSAGSKKVSIDEIMEEKEKLEPKSQYIVFGREDMANQMNGKDKTHSKVIMQKIVDDYNAEAEKTFATIAGNAAKHAYKIPQLNKYYDNFNFSLDLLEKTDALFNEIFGTFKKQQNFEKNMHEENNTPIPFEDNFVLTDPKGVTGSPQKYLMEEEKTERLLQQKRALILHALIQPDWKVSFKVLKPVLEENKNRFICNYGTGESREIASFNTPEYRQQKEAKIFDDLIKSNNYENAVNKQGIIIPKEEEEAYLKAVYGVEASKHNVVDLNNLFYAWAASRPKAASLYSVIEQTQDERTDKETKELITEFREVIKNKPFAQNEDWYAELVGNACLKMNQSKLYITEEKKFGEYDVKAMIYSNPDHLAMTKWFGKMIPYDKTSKEYSAFLDKVDKTYRDANLVKYTDQIALLNEGYRNVFNPDLSVQKKMAYKVAVELLQKPLRKKEEKYNKWNTVAFDAKKIREELEKVDFSEFSEKECETILSEEYFNVTSSENWDLDGRILQSLIKQVPSADVFKQEYALLQEDIRKTNAKQQKEEEERRKAEEARRRQEELKKQEAELKKQADVATRVNCDKYKTVADHINSLQYNNIYDFKFNDLNDSFNKYYNVGKVRYKAQKGDQLDPQAIAVLKTFDQIFGKYIKYMINKENAKGGEIKEEEVIKNCFYIKDDDRKRTVYDSIWKGIDGFGIEVGSEQELLHIKAAILHAMAREDRELTIHPLLIRTDTKEQEVEKTISYRITVPDPKLGAQKDSIKQKEAEAKLTEYSDELVESEFGAKPVKKAVIQENEQKKAAPENAKQIIPDEPMKKKPDDVRPYRGMQEIDPPYEELKEDIINIRIPDEKDKDIIKTGNPKEKDIIDFKTLPKEEYSKLWAEERGRIDREKIKFGERFGEKISEGLTYDYRFKGTKPARDFIESIRDHCFPVVNTKYIDKTVKSKYVNNMLLIIAARQLAGSTRNDAGTLNTEIKYEDVFKRVEEMKKDPVIKNFILDTVNDKYTLITAVNGAKQRPGHGGKLDDMLKEYVRNLPPGEISNDKLHERYLPTVKERIEIIQNQTKTLLKEEAKTIVDLRKQKETIHKAIAETIILRNLAKADKGSKSSLDKPIPCEEEDTLKCNVEKLIACRTFQDICDRRGMKELLFNGHGGNLTHMIREHYFSGLEIKDKNMSEILEQNTIKRRMEELSKQVEEIKDGLSEINNSRKAIAILTEYTFLMNQGLDKTTHRPVMSRYNKDVPWEKVNEIERNPHQDFISPVPELLDRLSPEHLKTCLETIKSPLTENNLEQYRQSFVNGLRQIQNQNQNQHQHVAGQQNANHQHANPQAGGMGMH